MRPLFLLALSALGLAAPLAAQERTPLPPGVEIVSRADWGGLPAVAETIPQRPRALTVHHSGTPQRPDVDPAQGLRNLYAFSTRQDTLGDGRVKAAWADVPYHFVIAPDGTILEARDVAFEGDTNTRYDLSGHALVVLQGNFDEEQPTTAQMTSLLALSEALARQWGFGPGAVAGHADRAPGQTVCPGDALEARLPAVRAAVAAGARQSLAGTWDADGPAASLRLAVGPDGSVSGTMGEAAIRHGRADATGDRIYFSFTTTDGTGDAVTHGSVHAGRIEATTSTPGQLTVWTAARSE